MKLGIMQPYFFPYIGYFQLINAVDEFVIYDDVSYIKTGWINRNKIIITNEARYITVPVTKASTNYLINETKIVDYRMFRKRLLKTIKANYIKAPQFKNVFNLLKEIFSLEFDYICELNIFILHKLLEYLDIETKILISSKSFKNQHLSSQQRILDICEKLNASHYINLIGGVDLYDKEGFKRRGIKLSFIKRKSISYEQFNDNFIPDLSIIDVMMFNSVEKIHKMLNNYELI